VEGGIIDQRAIGAELVTEVKVGLRTAIQQGLYDRFSAFPHNIPADDAACGAVYSGQDVDFVFLSPIKVNSSSNSTMFGFLSGRGGVVGTFAVCALIQLMTVW